jgi:hypothetical protein
MTNLAIAFCALIIVPVVVVDILRIGSVETKNVATMVGLVVCLLLAAMTLAGG